jgi:hypothetical protein
LVREEDAGEKVIGEEVAREELAGEKVIGEEVTGEEHAGEKLGQREGRHEKLAGEELGRSARKRIIGEELLMLMCVRVSERERRYMR